jgi:hypothetical protein
MAFLHHGGMGDDNLPVESTTTILPGIIPSLISNTWLHTATASFSTTHFPSPRLLSHILFSPLLSSLLVSSYLILDMRFPSPHKRGFKTAASILSCNLPSMGNRP